MGSHPQRGAYLALVSVCFFWGTTYLGIRVALESWPVLWLVATRFMISGSLLLIWAWWRGEGFPQGQYLGRTALNGVITLGIANGALTFAETLIPSGLAALFITTAPFWMTGVDAAVPGGERLHRPALIGMAVGLIGVLLLVGPDALGARTNLATVWGFLILQLGNFGWSLGSILQKRLPRGINPFVSGGVQQFAAGAVYLVAALIFRPGAVHWNVRGVLAVAYLIVFGSIVAYSSYLIALDRLPVAIVSVYTYVNPVVAVSLGWLFYREPFGWRELVAMIVIFLGVWLVKRFTPSGAPPARASHTPALVEQLRPERAAETGGHGVSRK
jgi:drug/metabolite transporter (DMT)-like permease